MLGGGDQRGVLEMAAEDIFRQISESTTRDFLLRVSFVEIYNEAIRDLLSNDVDASVSIREDPKKVMIFLTANVSRTTSYTYSLSFCFSLLTLYFLLQGRVLRCHRGGHC